MHFCRNSISYTFHFIPDGWNATGYIYCAWSLFLHLQHFLIIELEIHHYPSDSLVLSHIKMTAIRFILIFILYNESFQFSSTDEFSILQFQRFADKESLAFNSQKTLHPSSFLKKIINIFVVGNNYQKVNLCILLGFSNTTGSIICI